MDKGTIYIAGKITGDPNYRRKFEQAAERLQRAGYTVLSPAILPPSGFDYAAYIRMSVAMLDECAAVCLLPDWTESEGARGEYHRAKRNKQSVFFYEQFELQQGEKYMIAKVKTDKIAFQCLQCAKFSVYPAKSADGRKCKYCGGCIVPMGYAERTGETNATE